MSYVLPRQVVPVRFPRRVLIQLTVRVASIIQRRDSARLRELLTTIACRARPAAYEETNAIKEQVLTASPECRGNDACLTRSITIALLCRLRGRWPSWCVGVSLTPPFTAHAWVEAEDRVVEDILLVGDYRTFYKVEAGRSSRSAARP
ncbi:MULTISPECIES: lasso peptide biosynthesis B2 protein [unclassified Brevibacterium]|uniref:lasso peptide biosynthesis B2 protein n=1 Tax=unclassified Brevibacterium TaxID=2614124 RepID=UPI0008A1CAAD|nr:MULTISPECIES: lasso peptide biosynthesis B2 protein [unclassified Brevibacterium]